MAWQQWECLRALGNLDGSVSTKIATTNCLCTVLRELVNINIISYGIKRLTLRDDYERGMAEGVSRQLTTLQNWSLSFEEGCLVEWLLRKSGASRFWGNSSTPWMSEVGWSLSKSKDPMEEVVGLCEDCNPEEIFLHSQEEKKRWGYIL